MLVIHAIKITDLAAGVKLKIGKISFQQDGFHCLVLHEEIRALGV